MREVERQQVSKLIQLWHTNKVSAFKIHLCHCSRQMRHAIGSAISFGNVELRVTVFLRNHFYHLTQQRLLCGGCMLTIHESHFYRRHTAPY